LLRSCIKIAAQQFRIEHELSLGQNSVKHGNQRPWQRGLL